MKINYFGTDLKSPGHHFWELEGNNIYRSRLRFDDIPFNPESLPYIPSFIKGEAQVRKIGMWYFYDAFNFKILAIEGSCVDLRRGSNTIFWIEAGGIYDSTSMIKTVLGVPIAKKIIDSMPFTVNFFDDAL